MPTIIIYKQNVSSDYINAYNNCVFGDQYSEDVTPNEIYEDCKVKKGY